jgi:hypothetical protein
MHVMVWRVPLLEREQGRGNHLNTQGDSMRTKLMLFAFVVMSAITPSWASAAKTCVDVYEQCLNDTWDSSGLTRALANLECAARYAGCLRAVII